jgi:hypothetical protein
MSEDKKTVPQPNEARRGEDEIHYHEVDETNVGDAGESQTRDADEAQPPEAGE